MNKTWIFGMTYIRIAFALSAVALAGCIHTDRGEVATTDKRIISHAMVSMAPDYCMPDRPLDTWTHNYQKAADLGINELTWFMSRGHASQIDMYIATAKEAEKIPGFSISMCIGLPRCRLERDWLGPVKKWCDAAKDNPGIAKVNGRALIWTYHAAAFPIAEWRKFIDKLHEDGYYPFFVGDMCAFAFVRPKQFLAEVDQWAELFDSLYMFGMVPGERFEAMLAALEKAGRKQNCHKPLIGTAAGTGGYWRWGNDKQSPRSQLYNGTGSYVKKWDYLGNYAGKLDWVHVTTWNDFLEHTMTDPSRNNSGVYGELLQIYGSGLKGLDYSPSEKYWITAPAEVRNGPAGLNEYIYEVKGTGIRGNGAVELFFRDDKGKVLRKEAVTLTPETDVYRFSWEPKKNEFASSRYLTMDAVVKGSSGEFVGRLPVLVWPADEQRIMYKMPRTLQLLTKDRLPEKPVITVDDKGKLHVTPMPKANDESVRVDLLYNMHTKGKEGVNLGGVVKGVKQLPEFAPYDPYYFQRGFRQAALVTRDGRVSWADPVWVDKDLPMPETTDAKIDIKAVTSKPFKGVKINFQNSQTKTPAGFQRDKGLPFGDRRNGYYYGWSRNVEVFTRARKLDDNVIYDTLIPFRYYLSSWSWKIALPNGKYALKIGLGDAAFRSTWELKINGKTHTDPTPKKMGSDDLETTAQVKDNYLKLSVGPGKGAGINYIEIEPVK